MHFLRTLFWVLIAVALLIFALQNNGIVTVNLWGGLQADVKLWLLVIAPFLLGFVPTWIFHRISLWQRRRATHAAASRAATVTRYEMKTSHAAPGLSPDGTTVSHPAASPVS